jgi:hypothetical protein
MVAFWFKGEAMKPRVLLAGLMIPIALCACSPGNVPLTPTPTFKAASTTGSTPMPAVIPTATLVQLTLHVVDKLVNCRFGPGIVYELVDELSEGQSARVLGRNDTSTWWFIRDPGNPHGYCWVSANVTEINGDAGDLPIYQPPVTSVNRVTLNVEPNRVEVGCTQFPQTFFFEAALTANGPLLVNWQWEASTGVLSDVGTIVFDEAGTKVINEYYQVGGPNDYWVKLHILSPNVLTKQANFRASCTP